MPKLLMRGPRRFNRVGTRPSRLRPKRSTTATCTTSPAARRVSAPATSTSTSSRWRSRRTTMADKRFMKAADDDMQPHFEDIQAHYDLSNDFFGLFQDPTRKYSCAYFTGPDVTLEEAQLAGVVWNLDKL